MHAQQSPLAAFHDNYQTTKKKKSGEWCTLHGWALDIHTGLSSPAAFISWPSPFSFDQNNGQDSGVSTSCTGWHMHRAPKGLPHQVPATDSSLPLPEFSFYLRIKQHFSNFRLCEMAGTQPKSEQGTEIAAAKKQNVWPFSQLHCNNFRADGVIQIRYAIESELTTQKIKSITKDHSEWWYKLTYL